MTTEKTYNGWTNYETWNVALRIGNDQGSSEYWQEATQEAYDQAEGETHQEKIGSAAGELADRIKSEITEGMPDLGASMYSDILSAALSDVNWYEIAENWLGDVDKPEYLVFVKSKYAGVFIVEADTIEEAREKAKREAGRHYDALYVVPKSAVLVVED